jgi:glycosyltransferase involved in cell wall biosynthesis
VVPDAIDDPDRVSGGNVYDRHVRAGLQDGGWDVRMLELPDLAGSLRPTLSALPLGALVLLDGLLAVREPDALIEQAGRLRIVVLAHMVASLLHETGRAGDAVASAEQERDALRAAQRVVATSNWTRSELVSRGLAEPHRVVVAHPGTDAAPATVPSLSGGRVLCVGVVAAHKGQDLLVHALARLTDVGDDWACTFVGSLDRDSGFVADLRRDVERAALTDRVVFSGVLAGPALAKAYSRADLVVVPSRSESYGMVAAEALARGIPVVATDVGGIPEAIAGNPGGVVVPPEDPWALEVVLRQWWTDPSRRRGLTAAALRARETARTWDTTIAAIAATLREVALSESAVTR